MEGVSLEARASVATNVWSNFSNNRKQQECGMSQWIVLGNYLESLMQVGVLYEMVGAAKDAECAFQNGLNISNAKDILLGQAAFGSCLGEIYRKCHKWKIAEKTFQDAMKVFCRPDVKYTCELCKVTVEAALKMRIGDFFRRCPRQRKNYANFYKELTSAFDIYMSAKEMLHNIGSKYSDMPLDRKMHTECCGSNSQASMEGNAESISKLESSSRISKNEMFSLSIESVLLEELISFTVEHHRRSLMSRLLLQIGKCHETSGEFLKAYEICLENISLHFFHIDGLPCICSFINAHHCQEKCPGWRIPVDTLLIERAALLYHISWFSLKKNLPELSWTQCCSSSENLRSFVIGCLHHAFFICNQMPALLQKVSILLAVVHMPLAFGGLFSVPEDYTSNLSGSHWSAYFHQVSLGTTLREEHLAVLDAKLASQDSDTNEVLRHNNSRDVIERVQQVLRPTPDKLDCLEPFVTSFFRSVPLPTIVCISLLDCRYASILEEPSFTNSSSAWIFISRFDSNGPPVVLLLPIHSTFNGTRTDAVEGSNLCSMYSIRNLEDDLKSNDIFSTSKLMDVVAQEFRMVLEENFLSCFGAPLLASNEEKIRWLLWRMQLDNHLANLLRGIEDSWLGPWKCLLLGKPSEADYCDALQTHMQELKSMVDSAALNIRKEDYFPVDTGLLKTLLGGLPSLTINEIEKCICCLLWSKHFKLLQRPSLAQMTSLDCSTEWNGKENIHGSILSLRIDEESACQDIIGKTAKELSSIFQCAASRKNHYYKYNIHDNEPRKSSRKRKKQLREEDSTECRSSESFLLRNLSNDLENLSTMYIPREPVVLVLDSNSQVLPWESLPILRNQEVYRMPSVGSISAAMISRGRQEMVACFEEKKKKMLHLRIGSRVSKAGRFNLEKFRLQRSAV
ncbi:hypothetical protein SUGI_0280580 [Cryptomeria japonica]|nr:hypothetical protein SUGI_0280580 [Cryptomeria japonica]